MKLTIYQIDAFAEKPFEGNPAAVVPLQEWLPVETMQAIAEENNLAETAFFVPLEDGFHIRWFTPLREVKLCGHATLASAYVLFDILDCQSDVVVFDSLSGKLQVTRTGELLTLNFPNQAPAPCSCPPALVEGLGMAPLECHGSEDLLAVFAREEDVIAMAPDFSKLAELDLRGVIATAPGSECDFVVRFFAPRYGINEDPVTGSAYTQAAPYWSARLAKTLLHARQLSARGGKLVCEVTDERVLISGGAVKYLEGSIDIEF